MKLSDRSVELKFNTLLGRRIALCVTGGIAAIETVKLSRELRRYGADVKAYMTPSAQKFITSLSLEWATEQPVVLDLAGSAEHIVDCDLVLVAPATLNTLNKIALGLADNGVTTLIASQWGKGVPIVFVPTMHESLSQNPVFKKNLAFLTEQKNMYFMEAKHEEGKEKFSQIDTMIARISHILNNKHPLSGKKVLITGGPTQAQIDPVRHIGNFSTGELSVRLAHELYLRGAKPTLVYGPGNTQPHSFYTVFQVTTPAQMMETVLSELQYQKYYAAIFSAAVLDHVPAQVQDKKFSSLEKLEVEFIQTPKIIREVDKVTRSSCENLSKGLFKIGFKLEWKKTKEELLEMGTHALESMNAHVVVANDLSQISDHKHPAFILDRSKPFMEVNSKKEIIETLIQKLTDAFDVV